MTNTTNSPSFASLIQQSIYVVPSFTLESGAVLREVPVAYKTWGMLNDARDNVMIICHAFTGSADVEDWWGPLMGPGKAFDPSRFFIFCANVLGSPYGTASPITINPETGKAYGPEFPPTTIRDDIRLHKFVLDSLSVSSVAVVIGGSMGGMAVLEWPLCTPTGYVRHIVPIATSARHSAWCISWGEAQRQSIYADPAYEDGFYASQPASGLAAARMAALLTYRSRDSFESRFGRRPQVAKGTSGMLTPPHSPRITAPGEARASHNDGLRASKSRISPAILATEGGMVETDTGVETPRPSPAIFSAQSYLRYQGDKFTARFDANCYIHITRKLDTHDVARERLLPGEHPDTALARVLGTLPPRTIVIGIETDGLFTISEQREIASCAPDAELVVIESTEGHDGFLLEFERINAHLLRFLKRELPELYMPGVGVDVPTEGFDIVKTSVFREAETDVAAW